MRTLKESVASLFVSCNTSSTALKNMLEFARREQSQEIVKERQNLIEADVNQSTIKTAVNVEQMNQLVESRVFKSGTRRNKVSNPFNQPTMNALHVKPLLDIFSAMTQSQASPQAQLEAELAKFDSQKWYFHSMVDT